MTCIKKTLFIMACALSASLFTSCFSHADLKAAEERADQSKYDYNAKRAEKSITQARYKYFYKINDTSAAKNENGILNNQNEDESKAKKQADEDKKDLETVKMFCCIN